MHSILSRYILRRWTTPLLGALGFYGFLLLANEMVALAKDIFTQGAPLRWLVPLLLTALPEILGMVLPMAAVLGGLLGTQQMMEGSELVAAQGLGAGRKTWLRPWAFLASMLVILAALNANVFVPAASRLQHRLQVKMAEEAKARFLRPGGQPWFPPGSPNSGFWVSPEGQVHIMESTPQGVQHLIAASMSYALEPKADGVWQFRLQLNDLHGALIQGGGNSVVHLHQEHQTLHYLLPTAGRPLPPTPMRYRGTLELLRSTDPIATLEWSRRITLPLATAALLLLGVGLGFGHPRFYKGGAILRSMGVIMLYYLLMKFNENMWIGGRLKSPAPLFLMPFPFFLWGWVLFQQRLRPHSTNRLARQLLPKLAPLKAYFSPSLAWIRSNREGFQRWLHGKGTQHGILRHWSTLAWWRNWASAIGGLLVLNLLIEYATLAGDLSKNGVHFIVFIGYWLWNLPPFLGVALPMAFLLGSLLALSEAAISREWLALRASGVSLLRWLWSSCFAWGTVLVATMILQIWIAPTAMSRANNFYRRILNRSEVVSTTRPWLYLGSTGVLWNLQGNQRWGFPLKAPGEAPVLLNWSLGDSHVRALAWGGLHLVQGPTVDRLFPARALRDSPSAEEAGTLDLVQWQKWAPDSERAYMLWSRLLGWLVGPCLVLAMLSFAFPGPRQGRGGALGAGLVAGLVFLGLQTLFGGAARASEIPAYWGVMAPLLLLLALSFLRLRRLRT